jgi:hypothetical protein
MEGKGGCGEQGAEMIQTMYAHLNKWIIKENKSTLYDICFAVQSSLLLQKLDPELYQKSKHDNFNRSEIQT